MPDDNDHQLIEAEQPRFDTERLSSLGEDVMWRCHGLDELSCRKALQMAARKWCQDTRTLSMVVEVGIPPDGVCVVEPPIEAQLLSAEYIGAEPPAGYRCHDPVEFGPDKAVFRLLPMTIRMVNRPERPARAMFRVNMVPNRDMEEYPAGFISRYGDAIVHGALMMLYNMRNAPWYDPDQVKTVTQEYQRYITDFVKLPSTSLNRKGWI